MAHIDDKGRELAAWLQRNYIASGRRGLATGEAFYKDV